MCLLEDTAVAYDNRRVYAITLRHPIAHCWTNSENLRGATDEAAFSRGFVTSSKPGEWGIDKHRTAVDEFDRIVDKACPASVRETRGGSQCCCVVSLDDVEVQAVEHENASTRELDAGDDVSEWQREVSGDAYHATDYRASWYFGRVVAVVWRPRVRGAGVADSEASLGALERMRNFDPYRIETRFDGYAWHL